MLQVHQDEAEQGEQEQERIAHLQSRVVQLEQEAANATAVDSICTVQAASVADACSGAAEASDTALRTTVAACRGVLVRLHSICPQIHGNGDLEKCVEWVCEDVMELRRDKKALEDGLVEITTMNQNTTSVLMKSIDNLTRQLREASISFENFETESARHTHEMAEVTVCLSATRQEHAAGTAEFERTRQKWAAEKSLFEEHVWAVTADLEVQTLRARAAVEAERLRSQMLLETAQKQTAEVWK